MKGHKEILSIHLGIRDSQEITAKGNRFASPIDNSTTNIYVVLTSQSKNKIIWPHLLCFAEDLLADERMR